MASAMKPAYLLNAAASGLLFGAGLDISQMVNPLKVLRFLDVGAIARGGWDPSLAFVIVPAIAVMFVAVRLGRRLESPLFARHFHEPAMAGIDWRLVVGAALFGIGWGMSGICPGPAIALIAFRPDNLLIFLVALCAGSWIATLARPRPAEPTAAPAE